MEKNQFPYLHGFSKEEQQRLVAHAEFQEFSIYQNIDFTEQTHVLEIGCGVGAQTERLLRRFPGLKVTGVDINSRQIEAARAHLEGLGFDKSRYELVLQDGAKLPFEGKHFDGAFFCWVLEHVPEPERVLGETKRVLLPGSPIYLTEPLNSSFFIEPYSPNMWKYWMAYNDFQLESGGDPFIGAKLGNLLQAQGYKDIDTQVRSWHFDARCPGLRRKAIHLERELLESACDKLISEKAVTAEVAQAMREELENAASDPDAVYLYSYMQARAIRP